MPCQIGFPIDPDRLFDKIQFSFFLSLNFLLYPEQISFKSLFVSWLRVDEEIWTRFVIKLLITEIMDEESRVFLGIC